MKRFAFGLLWGIGGYIAFAVASYFLIGAFSSNRHDRGVEAAMTSVFFFGPIGGVLAFVAGIVRGGRSAAKTDADRS
jgi:ABC-type branched-subunit amino acid transport system permease subunit